MKTLQCFASMLLLLCSVTANAQTLTNGAYTTNILVVSTTNSYTFSATSGDSIVLRMGAATFNPRIELYNPGGTLAGVGFNGGAGGRDAELSVGATNTGAFTVRVASQFGGGNGAYRLTLARSPGEFVVSPGDQGGAMTNGYQHSGTIDVGELDMWSFTANGGDTVVLRMGATGHNPQIRLFGPSGQMVASAFNGAAGGRDAEILPTMITNRGTYTVVVNSYYGNGAGAYILTLARAPGGFDVSAGDSGGPMISGARNAGTIDVGDLDLWSFTANAGDSILLRMGTTTFNPQIRLFGPDGKLVASAFITTSGGRDAEILPITATNSGAYTVVVNSYYANGAGDYILTLGKFPDAFTVSPGDEGGLIVNGFQQSGEIDVGDLDLWSFSASAGDSIVLRMGATGFNPHVRLFGPDGRLVASAFITTSGGRDTEILPITATNSGNFTVVVNSYYANGSSGYILTLAKAPGAFVVSPGDEGGAMTNGYQHAGTIDVGDLDLWSFSANAGDTIVLRMGAAGVNPHIRLFGPNGKLVASAFHGGAGGRDADLLPTIATNSGIFTVVVNSYFASAASSPYILTLARSPGAFVVSPGDQGGLLAGGVSQEGVIDVGDVDLWRFAACRDEVITLRCEEVTGGSALSPRIRLFARNGTLLATAANATVAVINFTATNSGLYTVLVDGGNLNQTGTYRLSGNGLSDELNLCVPKITGANLNLAGVGGTVNATFFLFASTNLLTPTALWTPILTNQFDQFGVFDYTTLHNPAVPQRFFLLQEQ